MSFEFPAGWTELPLEQLCARVSVGYVGETSSHYTEGTGVALIRSQNVRPNKLDIAEVKKITRRFHEQSKKSQLQAGDLLIVRVGQNRGDCAVLPSGLGDVNCANIVFARPARSYSDFLGAYFNTPRGHEALLSVSSGSAQLVLNTTAVAKIKVPVPPIDEAYAIGTLSRIFEDRITLLCETNATLEAIAQALFKSWFVDFDPVRAKMKGRAPEGMDEATAALFPDGFEESELGMMPAGWRVVKFEDFIKRLSVGKKFDQKSALNEGNVPILDQGKSGVIGFHNDLAGVCASLDHPVVVFANHTCYMRLITFDFSAIQNVLPFVGQDVDTVWAFYATKDRVKFSEYKGHWPDFAIEKAVNPSHALTLSFRDAVDPLMRSVRQNELQAQTLATLRDTLLPRLISGQLRLPEAETLLEEAFA